MYERLQIIFLFYFWSAIVRTYEQLQVICWLWFLECNRSHVRTIANHIFILFLECNRSHVRAIANHIFILFLECNRSHIRTIASHMLIVISRVQLFAHTNDCKSFFIFYFWSAILCTYKQLQVIFLFFWSAIVCTYERLQVIFYFLFLECNHSHVRTIASHILILISGSVPVCMCEHWLIERSEGMDRCSWSYAPHKTL
jgi:hypothetical protein